MLRTNRLALACSLSLIASCSDSTTGEAPQVGSLGSLSQSNPATTARSSPAQVADDFARALDANDEARWQALLSSAAVAEMNREGGDGMNFNGDKFDSWTVADAIITGEEASVPMTLTGEDGEQGVNLKLRRESGQWKVTGMGIAMGESEWPISFEGEAGGAPDFAQELAEGLAEGLAESMTEAFEGAMSDWEAGGSAEEIAAGRASYDALVSVDGAQHDASWKVNIDARGRSGVDVLAAILADSGYPVQGTEHFHFASNLELRGVSRLEALEALCVEAGVVPVFPDTNTRWQNEAVELSFREGTRTHPVTFTGPFQVELSELVENAPNTTGELTISVRALGLTPAVLAANQGMTNFLDIDEVNSASGESLFADPDVTYMGSPTVEHGLFEYTLSPDLVGLLRSVESLDVSGEVTIELPSEVHAGSFGSDAEQGEVKTGPWTATWRERSSYNQIELRHEHGETENANARFAPNFESGEPMGIQSESASSFGEYVSASLSTPQAPASLDFKVFRAEPLRYEFQVKDIALAHFAEQPAQLEALAFDGATPIEVKFVGFADRSDVNFQTVNVSVSNSSNLVVQDASATFEYLDASGTLLKDFPHNLAGEPSFEGPSSLAQVGASSQLEVTAFFMPAETTTVRVRVDEVNFVNGTNWKRE